MSILKPLLFGVMLSVFLGVGSSQAVTPPVPNANPVRTAAPVVTAGLAPEATANLQREFTLEGFFAGEAIGRGTIFSKTVGASRSFTMNTLGTWDGKILTLTETYSYASGEREARIWKFTKTGRNTYTGESDEIEKPAAVTIEGRTAKFKYEKRLPRPGGKKPVKVKFEETWSLGSNGVLSSTTVLKKFVRVGREAINFVRVGNEAALKGPGF